MAQYIVTGAAGFIGSRVAHFLLEDGHTVVGVDNLNDAYDTQLKHWRLAQLEKYTQFSWHQLDIVDRDAMDTLGEAVKGECHGLINLAARAGVRPSVANPYIYVDTNLTGTVNLLELARKRNIPKFVLASTSSLYGGKNPLPYREDAVTDHPLSPYAASKKAAEAMCFTYHHLHKIDVTVCRYFTVYGPAGRPDMSPLRFVQWISEGKPVHIFGDGQQSRDFTYVDDIARGTIAGLKPVGYEVFNLGSDKPISLLDSLRVMEEQIGKKADLVFHAAHSADMAATWADVTKSREVLGWQAQVSFQQGIANLVDWYRNNREWAKTIKTQD